MDEPLLAGVRIKLERAKVLLTELDDAVGRYLKTKPFKV
jgi:hypothetical protein